MKPLLDIAAAIDRFTLGTGRVVAWATLLMVLVCAFNTLARDLGQVSGLQLSSNTLIELQWYLFSFVFMAGAAYTLKRGGHVRVDVVYGRLSARHRAWINLCGGLLFLIPFCAAMILISWPMVAESWRLLEASSDAGGLPRYPIKTLIPLAFCLLIVQGAAECIKSLAVIRGLVPDAPDESEPMEGV